MRQFPSFPNRPPGSSASATSLAVVTGIVFLACFGASIVELVNAWLNLPDATHGLLIAPVAGWLAWRRGVVRPLSPAVWGGVSILVVGVAFAVLGRATGVITAPRVGIMVALVGVTVALAGWRQVIVWWLPFALLLLTIPLPESVIAATTAPLQELAARMGAAMLVWRDVPVTLMGNIIGLPGHTLFVSEACSGLRSLTAIVSMSLLASALFLSSVTMRVVLLACAMALAIVVNGIRVFLTGFLVYFVDPELGDGFMHLTEGYVLFLFSLLLLAALTWLFARIEKRLGWRTKRAYLDAAQSRVPADAAVAATVPAEDFPSSRTLYLPTLVLMAGTITGILVGTPRPTPLLAPLAEVVPREYLNVPSADHAIPPAELQQAGATDYLSRTYDVGSPLGTMQLYVGYHATQQGDHHIHSPTNCLPGAGWTPVSASLAPVVLRDSTVLVNRYVLQYEGHRILVYYWFQGRGRITWGQTTLRLNAMMDALRTRRDEESLVRIVVPIDVANAEASVGHTGLTPDSLAQQFAADVIPALGRALPPMP